MISSVYSYYLSQYGQKVNSRYDSHTRKQLDNTYRQVIKVNSHAPAYKPDVSEDAQKYAIDLKENARELNNIANNLSDPENDVMTFKKSAESSNPEAVAAEYIGDSISPPVSSFEVSVSQIATSQVNTGNYLPNTKLVASGDYSFDLTIHDLTYEFEFHINASETTKDVQGKIARLINRSNIGLSAQTLSDSLGNSAITITSDATGISGIRSTIFHISAIPADTSSSSDSKNTAGTGNSDLIATLGLDRVSQFPSNAVFSVDGNTRTSSVNEITINNAFSLSLKRPTDDNPATISLKNDGDSIVESISDLLSGYNHLLSIAANSSNDRFQGNQKLKREFSDITKSYRELLGNSGIDVNDDGTMSINRDTIIAAASSESINDIFSSLNSFKKAIQKKAEYIAIDPMHYVNNKIVAYKNPQFTVSNPYNLSIYTGMMFNDYI